LDYTTNKDELQSHQQNITLLEGKVMNRLENKWWFYLAQFLGVIFGSLVSQTKQETALRFARAHQEIEAALQQLEDKNSVR
jgi:hypothetical protein